MIEISSPQHHVPPIEAPAHAIRRRMLRCAPYLLMAFFGLWSLRALSDNIFNTDAPRHAMNGAFIADWLRSGKIAHPVEFGTYYYARLPALSMPYHPPVLPGIEAAFFLLFGVKAVVARVLIAIAAVLCVFLLYRFIMATFGSHLLAICTVATYFTAKFTKELSTTVMLELPALAFGLAALYQLRDLDKGLTLRRGLTFAFLTAAAVWTKQHLAFLFMVPFLYVLFSWRWRLLANKSLWISSAIVLLAVFALIMLSAPFGSTGSMKEVPDEGAEWILDGSLHYYWRILLRRYGPLLLGWALLGIAAAILGPRGDERRIGYDLSLAWAFAAFAILLPVGHLNHRYLFIVYPPLILLSYDLLRRIVARFASPAWSWVAPLAIAGLCLGAELRTTAGYIHGPAEAASVVVNGQPRRILYFGVGVGQFIFATRSLDTSLQTVVMRGEKFAGGEYDPQAFEEMAHKYGINYIVLVHDKKPRPWNTLQVTPARSMTLEREIPLSSTHPEWNGKIDVYQFTNPSPNPESKLNLHLFRIGREVQLEF